MWTTSLWGAVVGVALAIMIMAALAAAGPEVCVLALA
jgi:hypothetical protein